MAEYTGKVLKEQPNKAPTGATPSPTPIVSGAETATKFEEESAKQRAALEKSFEESKKETATTPGFTLEGLLTSPPALVTGGVVLGYLGAKAAPVISEGVTKLKDRWINKSIDTMPRIEPVGFDFPVQNFPETAPTVAPQIGQTNLTPEDLQAKLASMQQAPAVGPVAPSAAPQSPATQKVTETIEGLMNEPAAVKGSVKPTLSPAQAGIPMPVGVGTGDNWLFNTLGPEKYKAFINDTNAGRPFGNQYEAARTAYQAYYPGPKIPGNIAQERNIPRPPTNFGVIPPGMESAGPPTAEGLEALKKPVKPPKGATGQKGSISLGQSLNLLGNVLGIAGLAQSFKQGQKTGDYSEFGLGAIGQLLGNLAPKAGVGFSLMAPSTLGAGTLDSPEAQELMARNYNAGGGRGIAPPSSYQR